MTDPAIHLVSRKADDLSVRFPIPNGLPRLENQPIPRRVDFRNASLYPSPTTVHPTMGFCEAKSFFDHTGFGRLSKGKEQAELIRTEFLKNLLGYSQIG